VTAVRSPAGDGFRGSGSQTAQIRQKGRLPHGNRPFSCTWARTGAGVWPQPVTANSTRQPAAHWRLPTALSTRGCRLPA